MKRSDSFKLTSPDRNMFEGVFLLVKTSLLGQKSESDEFDQFLTEKVTNVDVEWVGLKHTLVHPCRP